MAADSDPAVFSQDVPALLLEISSRKRPFQVVAGPIFEQSMTEVEFDDQTHLVRQWWPLGRQLPIVLDPRIAFGAPVIAGTRIPTSILSLYTVGNPIATVAGAFNLTTEQVEAALGYESALAMAA